MNLELFLARIKYLNYRTRKSKAHIMACTVEDIISSFRCSAYRETALTVLDDSVEYLSLFSMNMKIWQRKKRKWFYVVSLVMMHTKRISAYWRRALHAQIHTWKICFTINEECCIYKCKWTFVEYYTTRRTLHWPLWVHCVSLEETKQIKYNWVLSSYQWLLSAECNIWT